MITLRKASERGHLNFGWLDANHSFSFGSYFDPKWSGFRDLRVINEDRIDPMQGFDTHPHKDMEIITFILEGELEHRDTLGNHAIIRPGEIQIMSAGSGVLHSEFNSSKTEKNHLLQIWIIPNQTNIKPRYDQVKYTNPVNGFKTLAANEPQSKEVVKLYQDASIELASFYGGHNTKKQLDFNRHYWIQIIKGRGEANNISFKTSDGFAISSEKVLEMTFEEETSFLFFDLN